MIAVALMAISLTAVPAGAKVKDFDHGVTAGEVTHNSAFFKPDPPNGVGMLCAQAEC